MDLTTDYFKNLIKTETQRLNDLCHNWTQVMENEADIPEDGFGQIRSTIGKTYLLINQRFKQFNGLIDDCELKRGIKETKVEDLQGFWDMIYFQVLDLNDGFKELDVLKANEWRTPEEEPKPVKKVILKKTIKLPKVDKNKPLVKSKIRETIQNFKNNKNSEQNEVKNESFGEKENKKIGDIITSDIKIDPLSKTIESKVKDCDHYCEAVPAVRNVLKRTPLLNSVKK